MIRLKGIINWNKVRELVGAPKGAEVIFFVPLIHRLIEDGEIVYKAYRQTSFERFKESEFYDVTMLKLTYTSISNPLNIDLNVLKEPSGVRFASMMHCRLMVIEFLAGYDKKANQVLWSDSSVDYQTLKPEHLKFKAPIIQTITHPDGLSKSRL